ncbi:MAG: type II toxin-antitoxin system VapC family toxin [Candidatus Helarchaeota archaeon]
MIYLDANIFIYAFFKPKKGKELSDKIKWCKQEAKKIIRMINEEKDTYCISLIQISEVVNLLKSVMSWENLKTFLMGLFSNKSIKIIENSKLMYLNAINKILDYNTDPNDISAYLLMVDKNIKKIYTFDRHFENFPGIICLPPFPDEFT